MQEHNDYTHSAAFVREINRAALAEVTRFENISVIDGFEPTHARADHMEHGEKGIGGHMVHHGPDIQELQNRQLLLLVLRQLCPQTLRQCQRRLASAIQP